MTQGGRQLDLLEEVTLGDHLLALLEEAVEELRLDHLAEVILEGHRQALLEEVVEELRPDLQGQVDAVEVVHLHLRVVVEPRCQKVAVKTKVATLSCLWLLQAGAADLLEEVPLAVAEVVVVPAAEALPPCSQPSLRSRPN